MILSGVAETAVPVGDGPGTEGGRRQRRSDSRERLLAAAADQFGEAGYFAVLVEDISSAAGVSRMTFYRHFRSKADLAGTLFAANVGRAEPQLLGIRGRAWHQGEAVRQWLRDLFAMDQVNWKLLRAFVQASAAEPEFTSQAHEQIAAWIAALGEAIPAFAVRRDEPRDRRRWLEAWLLIYEILDQSNHAALSSGIARDPLVIDILADRFSAFVASGDAP